MRPRRVLFVQHGDPDKPGLVAEALAERGIPLDVLRPDLGEAVPTGLGDYSGLVLGGGAQAVYETDRYPYLGDEIRLVRAAAAAQKPVLGLCLGGQLMAAALGAEVRRAPQREIGFFPVELEPIADLDPVWGGLPRRFVTTHWHGDIFEVPPGGMRMGHSALTSNQLFRYGGALYGMQFHLEMTPEVLDEMVDDARDDLMALGVDPEGLRSEGHTHLPTLRDTARTVFHRWADFL